MTSVAALEPGHRDELARFLTALGDGDRTFIKEDVSDVDIVLAATRPGRRWVALEEDGAVTGFLAVLPLPGWSDHVGEIRLVVHPGHRGTGLGRALARWALLRAVEMGLSKVVVEVVAEADPALRMFTALGFTGEALLRDHIRDRRGQLRDLVMLAHYVDDTASAMETIGLADEVGGEVG